MRIMQIMSREIFVGVANLMRYVTLLAITLLSIGAEKYIAVLQAWLL